MNDADAIARLETQMRTLRETVSLLKTVVLGGKDHTKTDPAYLAAIAALEDEQ